MIRYLALDELLALHQLALKQSGGMPGLRDLGGLESALAQPRMTFGGEELYPRLAEKAAALCYSLVSNHPFVDGNKRVGHAAMETFLVLDGHEACAPVDEQEEIALQLAAGTLSRDFFTSWVQRHLQIRNVS